MQNTGCLGLVHWDDPGGWYAEEGGRGVQDGEHLYTHGRFMFMYGKTNTIKKKTDMSHYHSRVNLYCLRMLDS